MGRAMISIDIFYILLFAITIPFNYFLIFEDADPTPRFWFSFLPPMVSVAIGIMLSELGL